MCMVIRDEVAVEVNHINYQSELSGSEQLRGSSLYSRNCDNGDHMVREIFLLAEFLEKLASELPLFLIYCVLRRRLTELI